MSSAKRETDRAKKTLYVTGYDSKRTTKHLLEELFTQGGPLSDISMFDTHAFVQFQHEESVPYCLALFNELELHGHKLRISPRSKSRASFGYLKYLMAVREKLMTENRKITPPDLPQRQTLSKLMHEEFGTGKSSTKKFRQAKKNKMRSKRASRHRAKTKPIGEK